MQALKISMSPEAKIRLEPDGDISDDVWESVVDWWSIERKADAKSKFIDVGIPEFSQRKLWLRENWRSLGYGLTIDDEVKVALRNVDGLMTQFAEIASRDESGLEAINLDSIKLTRPLTEFQKKNMVHHHICIEGTITM
jgi:hypothetical protein